MSDKVINYKGKLFPSYLKDGNAQAFIAPVAKHFCTGEGLEIGPGRYPVDLPNTLHIDRDGLYHAMSLPDDKFSFIFSSHCLEHLDDPIGALRYWLAHLRIGGRLFLYLPHPDVGFWHPSELRAHKSIWAPEDMEKIFQDLGLTEILRSERDGYWSFFITGIKS